MAQMWPPSKPKLKQEEFDEAVKTNIEDFDMEADEAVESAVKEFELQGYDLSIVVRSSTAMDFDSHAVAVATRRVGGSLDDAEALTQSVQQFQDVWKAQASNQQEANAVALKAHSLKALLEALTRLAAAGSMDGQRLALTTCRALMLSSVEVRDTFVPLAGCELVQRLLADQSVDSELVAPLISAAEAAALKQEDAKCKFVESGFAVSLLELLLKPELSAEATSAACACIRSFTTADDDRPPASKAFIHARALCKHNAAMRVLLSVLRRVSSSANASLIAVALATVRQVAANDSICKEFTDDGGITVVLDILKSNLNHKELCRSCCGALRQLANSDSVKTFIAGAGGIDLVLSALANHPEAEDLAEAGLGLLASSCLRLPEVSTKVADAGGIDAALELMSHHPSTWGPVHRQSCIMLRNMVVRNPELRPMCLEKGAEALLRAVQKASPKDCQDVGAAALRDLGLDNYGNTMV